MIGATEELVRICQELPADKVGELVDFARLLHQRTLRNESASPEDGDAAWERILNDPRPRPKLDAFVNAALAEGPVEPLDPDRL
ncbi:MAG: hypothetical protein HYY24_08835 [Verrucomicrobia bacterium]|nr:hypothetical protein [Verrucomicrobiota bacterium]